MSPKSGKPQSPSNVDIHFYKSSGRDSVRYVSDLAVYEEAMDHDRLIGLYWSAGGQVMDKNTVARMPLLSSLRYPLHTFELNIDGQLLHNRWQWVGAERREGPRPGTVEAVVELKHKVRPVTVKVVTRLDGSPVLVRYLEITNTSDRPAALSSVSPMSGVLWNTYRRPPLHVLNMNSAFDLREPLFTLSYFGTNEHSYEGDLVTRPLPPEGFCIDRTDKGRSWAAPYYIVSNEATGEKFFIALAWSANFRTEFSVRDGLILHFRSGPSAPAPLRVIAPGETVSSPEIHIAPLHGTADEAVGQWYRHMRGSVIPPRPKGKEMYTVAGHVVEEPGEWILREIDVAAEMGVEAFMVDAGWYGEKFASWWAQRGDWNEGDWLPEGGIAGIRDYTHGKGMLFGLWHETEAISDKTRLRERHDDWVLRTDDGRQCAETLNMADPAAAKYAEDSVIDIIGKFKLDFYKLDYNVFVDEGGQNIRDGYAESEFWRHYETLYRIYDRALAEFPDVCLENCAGGGGRNDLGMLSRFHYACESDHSVPGNCIRAVNTLSLFVPPEAICYYHNLDPYAHHGADIETHLRMILFTVPVFVTFGAQDADRDTEFFRRTRKYIDLHKGFCRPVLARHPDVFHHTPNVGVFTPADWCVLEYAAKDKSRGYAGVFKLTSGEKEYQLKPRGVNMAADYEVTLDSRGQCFRMPGRQLAEGGLTIRLDSTFTSELVLYKMLKTQPV